MLRVSETIIVTVRFMNASRRATGNVPVTNLAILMPLVDALRPLCISLLRNSVQWMSSGRLSLPLW